MSKPSKNSNTYTRPCPSCGEGTITVSTTMGYTEAEIAYYFACAKCRANEDAYWEKVAKTEPDAWVAEEFDES